LVAPTEAQKYWDDARVEAVNAVLVTAEIALEDVRGLLEEMASPTPTPRPIPA
jgi:hypothetical protein